MRQVVPWGCSVMKKVSVILFLVAAVLLTGCRSASGLKGSGEIRSTALPGKTYFWDKDLRPTMAVPASPRPRPQRETPAPEPVAAQPQRDETPQPEPQRTELAAEAPRVEPQREPVARAPVESARRPAALSADLVTPNVEPLQPVRTGLVSSSYDRVAPIGRSVFVDETGGRVLSITYPRADYGIIQVDKTMPEEVRLNTLFSYTMKVTNLTETMLTEIIIAETVSDNFEFKGSEPMAQVEGNKLVWLIESLGPKASKTLRVSGVATASKSLEQSTAITHTIRDSAVVRVVEPTLELRKMAPAEALLCEPIAVEYIVTNTGTGAAQDVQVIDNLPAGMQTADGKGKVILEAGTLMAGETRRFAIKLRAVKTGAYVGKALATSSTGLKAESEATTTNVRQPMLTITKSGPHRQYLGRPVAYEISVFNKGDGPAQNTIIEDIIPPGVTGIEATAGAQLSGSKLIWDLGTLEPNTSKKVRVSYTPAREGELMGSATASAYCAEPVTDSAKTTITGIAATRLDVIDLDDPVEVGGTTTYLITVSNEGSAADANIRLVCTLDDKLQYVSSAGATAGSLMGRTVSFAPLQSLEPKTKATWRVVVKGAQSGDVRFKVAMHTDEIALPIEEMEATHVYQQNGGY
jgi:uncharacterized repeat protein (TIGR01451 family)